MWDCRTPCSREDYCPPELPGRRRHKDQQDGRSEGKRPQTWFAIHSARKTYALPVAAGQDRTADAHLGVISFGEAENHRVHVGHVRGIDDFCVLALLETVVPWPSYRSQRGRPAAALVTG